MAIVLLAIGVVGVFGGIAALTRAQVKAERADLLQRLAVQKLDEMVAVTDPRTSDTEGDFTDQGHPEVTWSLGLEPSGAENVDRATITAAVDQDEQTVVGLLYIPPITGGAGAPGTDPPAGGAP